MVAAEAVGSPRLLVAALQQRESLAAYRSRGGYADASAQLTPEEILKLVDESGLRGRGGSAFPTGRKWRSVAAQAGRRVLLVNAAESEPASRKDALLLTRRPHLVIEGVSLAARAVGADEWLFYVHEGADDAVASVKAAVAELIAAGHHVPRWRVVAAPRRYVAGEETAAVQRCNGKPALPAFKPPLPFQQGVGGQPTLINNVETYANVPLIVRDGPAAFRAVGHRLSPGTVLLTLSGAIKLPGVYEAPTGTPIVQIITELGGGLIGGAPIQAVLPGGYFAGWVDGNAVRSGLTLDPESLTAQGAAAGAGAITVIPDGVCGLAQAAALLRFFADESARQCGPCTYGTDAMAAILERVVEGTFDPTDLPRLQRYADSMLPKRGACGHLDGATIAARTAMRVFVREIEQHRRGGCGRSRRVLLPGLEERRG